MQTYTELSSSQKIKNLFQQFKAESFRQGTASVFVSYSQDDLEDNINRLQDTLNKITEDEFLRYAERGLLYHQSSLGIENYWKNVGSYLQISIDDIQTEIDAEESGSQMKLL